jgi:hypothetical protein
MKEIKVTVYGWWTSYAYRNRTKKPLAIALSGAGRGLRGRDNGSNVNNVQYKSNRNCHYETPPHKEYILMKKLFKKK